MCRWDITGQKKRMKKILLVLAAVLFTFNFASAQQRKEIQKDVYLVMYGDKLIIEDDANGRSISMEVYQAGLDRQNGEMMYNVVCGKYTKKVLQWGLKEAIKAGFKAAGATGGWSLTASAIGLAADIGYDYLCNKWGKNYDD